MNERFLLCSLGFRLVGQWALSLILGQFMELLEADFGAHFLNHLEIKLEKVLRAPSRALWLHRQLVAAPTSSFSSSFLCQPLI
jgi:hypothetical protein